MGSHLLAINMFSVIVFILYLSVSFVSSTSSDYSASIFGTALDFIARTALTSLNTEVPSINFTGSVVTPFINTIIILVLLKFVVFGYQLISGEASARSSDPIVSGSELSAGFCFLLYGIGDEMQLPCLKRSACEDPKEASPYLTAAHLWYTVHTVIKDVPFSDKYKNLIEELDRAVEEGQQPQNCLKY